MTEKRKQLRWRREPRATGLAAVCQGTRGWELHYGGDRIGSVAILRSLGGPRYSDGPWFWYASNKELRIPWKNTSADKRVIKTSDEAKKECRAYVEKHLIRE